MMEGAGSFDRVNTTGNLALNSSAASLRQLTALIAPLAPTLAARLDAIGAGPGPARMRLWLDLDKNPQQADRASARAVFDFDAPLLEGTATITARPVIAAVHGIDLDALGRSEFAIESRLSGEGRPLLAALRLDHAIAAGAGPAQFEGSVTGTWRAPLRLKVKMSGTGLDAEGEGTAEPWASEPKASVNLKVRSIDLAPMLGLKPSDALARNISLSSRVALSGNRLSFDDLDGAIAGARLRGRVALTLDDEKNVEGRTRSRRTRSRAGVCPGCRRRRARCRRPARRGTAEGLARPHRLPGAARHLAGRRRIASGERRRSGATASR